MGKLSNVKVGDKRADGAVCVKEEWVSKCTETGLYFPRRWGAQLTTILKDAAAMRKIAGSALLAYGLGVRFSKWVSIPEAPLPTNCAQQNAIADEFHELCKEFFDKALEEGVGNG